MSLYRCHCCDTYKDADMEGCNPDPCGEYDEICDACLDYTYLHHPELEEEKEKVSHGD